MCALATFHQTGSGEREEGGGGGGEQMERRGEERRGEEGRGDRKEERGKGGEGGEGVEQSRGSIRLLIYRKQSCSVDDSYLRRRHLPQSLCPSS
eukprot:768031-Hanusia_phi.AAC.4